ncbi:MAG: response regulator, partial [Rhodomicrobium sp.]|nr:response regulator [Rhodomicrobium sp.]
IDVTYYLQAAYSSLYQQETKTILLADDDLFFRDTLKPVLIGAGYKVTSAGSAAQLMELLEQRKDFDALLIDAEMETADGEDLADHLRVNALKADFPVFRLYERPAHAVLNIPATDPMTMNLSKLDRQGLLSTLASVLVKQDTYETSKELAA